MNSTALPKPRPHRAAFTLIELLVAMAITLIIFFVIHTLFNTTSQIVSLGAATSALIGGTRGVSDQINRDAAAMIGPSGGGFLVIRTQSYNVQVVTPARETTAARPVESDQLSFIAWRGTVEPICPGNSTSFSNSSTAPYLRIWYGHGRKTNADGSDGGDMGSSPNDVGSTWLLCRQALFLQGATPGLSLFAAGVAPSAPVSGSNGSPGNADLMHALTDISNWTLENLTANWTAGSFNLDDLTFINGRLRVNPIPSGQTYSSWQIAQCHPAFVANVSDFYVEFAADQNNNGRVDTVSGGGADTSGGVYWYSQQNLTCTPTSNNWPYLIRLRWRVHDWRGKIVTAGQTGKWFEQILKVNRN